MWSTHVDHADFHDFGNFGQRVLTTCYAYLQFDIENLERIIWSRFPPNILVGDFELTLGAKKK